MNRLPMTAVCACCAILTTPTLAQSGHGNHAGHAHAEPESSNPVNAMCPIGKEPIEESGGQSVYKGKTIGFCCPGCDAEFSAWDESKKDEFVAMAMMGSEPGIEADHGAMSKEFQDAVVPYMFNTCAVSGEELGSMGDPIVKTYEGREVKFCCKMCVPRFEKDLKASLAKLDQKIIDSQLPFYPMTTCVVSDEAFGGDMGDPINVVHRNRLVRLCCKMCKGDFKEDPQAYITKLDAAVVAQQSEHYPLSSCPISGEALGSMGDAINVVYAGRLVKFCCAMCTPKFEADPMPIIEKIDAAWESSKTGIPGHKDD
jgi:YHS domain-containing protein